MIPGIHASTAGGLDRALDTVGGQDLDCCQIFTSNQRRWKGRELRDLEIRCFQKSSLTVISHASYLINLASIDPAISRKSRRAMADELCRMHELGIRWTVVHPGHHLGIGHGAAAARIAKSLNSLLKEAPDRTGILLENTAGQGTSVGHSPVQLEEILDLVSQPDRTGVCFDTCHAFASGMDLSSRTGVDIAIEDLERTVGLEMVRAFHLNDSLGELGSHRDRHAALGSGGIGLDPLRYLVSLDFFRECPGIVEAPGTDMDRARQARQLLS